MMNKIKKKKMENKLLNKKLKYLIKLFNKIIKIIYRKIFNKTYSNKMIILTKLNFKTKFYQKFSNSQIYQKNKN